MHPHHIFLHYVLVPQLIINLPIAEGSKLVPGVLNIGVRMASKQENGCGVYGPAPSNKPAADLCRVS